VIFRCSLCLLKIDSLWRYKLKVLTLLAVSISFWLVGCSQPSEDMSKEEVTYNDYSASEIIVLKPRENKNHLSQAQAVYRSSRVSGVSYKLNFILTGKDKFSNTTKISFDLSDASQPLTLDLDKAEIESLMVNGVESDIDYNQWFITLAAASLNKGQNNIVVKFSRLHSSNGEGLHRFVDPVDNKVYLYSHFEPAAAHQMFALFDQPDLKATYQLTVSAPNDWSVISATKESKIIKNETSKNGIKSNTWHFPVTKKLSPYNFSMHAGPYKVWSDDTGKYPMRLFARQSIAEKINPEDWFKYTALGLQFFDNYFGIDYPFEKYDQVIVPDFIYGAMENAAAITFAERAFVSSAEMTQAQKQRLAGVIMHEMAHQWFGDLVTMKWWNGLWLNESFASFMGTLATAEATEFDYAWRSFYAGNKQGAYIQDQRVTTHPIEVPVSTTLNAFDNIDAITYSKGASTLMQLRHLLGADTFQKGVHNYLKKYSYKNAELDDFIGSLAETAGRSLDDWKQQWLYQAGVNTINVNYQCDAHNKVTELVLLQTADKNYPVLREQKIQIGLFSLHDGQLKLNQAIPVIYSGDSTMVKQAIGSVCPDLVYPNYQDWGFAKVNLDQRSFLTAKNHLSSVSDPLLRSMLWQSLWDSVRDGELPLNDYLDVALANISMETDYTILGQSLGGIRQAMNYVKLLGDKTSSYQKKVQPKIEVIYWQNAINNQLDANFQKRWFSSYISTAETMSALAKLKQILDDEISIEGIILNQDYRWNIIYQLNRYDFENSLSLIEKELLKDTGDSGQKQSLAAKAVRPDGNAKAKWLEQIHRSKPELPFPKLRRVIGNLYTSEQNELVEQTADKILTKLPVLDAEQGPIFMRSYTRSLIPATCNDASVERLNKAIKDNPNLSNISTRALLIAHQEDERCVLIGSKFLSK